MPSRTISVNGSTWSVTPSGRVTQYDRDEFALIFTRHTGGKKEVRVARYSSASTRSREMSFAQLTDDDLMRLLSESQSGATSPEAQYQA